MQQGTSKDEGTMVESSKEKLSILLAVFGRVPSSRALW